MRLRLVAILLASSCLYAFSHELVKTGIGLSIILVLLAFITNKNFIGYIDSFEIRKYYLYGFFIRKWKFEKKDHFTIALENSGDSENYFIDELGVGCVLALIFFIYSTTKSGEKYKIQKFDYSSLRKSEVKLHLTKEETNFISKIESTGKGLG